MIKVSVVHWMKTTRVKEHKRLCIMPVVQNGGEVGKIPMGGCSGQRGDKNTFLTIWSKQKKKSFLSQANPEKRQQHFFLKSQSMVPLENKPVQFNSLEAKLIKGKGGIRGGLLISQINWHPGGARTDRGGCFNGLDCSLEHLFWQSKVGGATIYNAFIIVVLQRQVKTS